MGVIDGDGWWSLGRLGGDDGETAAAVGAAATGGPGGAGWVADVHLGEPQLPC